MPWVNRPPARTEFHECDAQRPVGLIASRSRTLSNTVVLLVHCPPRGWEQGPRSQIDVRWMGVSVDRCDVWQNFHGQIHPLQGVCLPLHRHRIVVLQGGVRQEGTRTSLKHLLGLVSNNGPPTNPTVARDRGIVQSVRATPVSRNRSSVIAN